MVCAKHFTVAFFFFSLSHRGLRAGMFQCSVMCMDAYWLDVFICGHMLRRMNQVESEVGLN